MSRQEYSGLKMDIELEYIEVGGRRIVVEAILSPLAPEGPMNAGELYEPQMGRAANDQSG